jgi:hypothetical protein
MKNLILGILVGTWLISCNETESPNNEFTGNETVYALEQGSAYNVSGTVIIKEKVDGTAFIEVNLSGTEGGIEHPTHLHMGNISTPGADVAALLNPVTGKTGRSETHLTQLADESAISYSELVNLNACIKVHLASSGPDRDIILAGGNIGMATIPDVSGGRIGFGVCKSE